ncbi:unnamed protein product [Pylaiella littoralis]
MLLVYAPVVAATCYIALKKCLPRARRRPPRQIGRDIAFTLAYVSAKIIRRVVAVRSSYLWDKRQQWIGPLRTVLDTLLRVDSVQAALDTSVSGHDSIRVLSAIATVDDRDCDVTKLLDTLWTSGDGVRVVVPIKEVSSADHVTIRILYRGHSNVSKRYPSQTFSVRYSGPSSEAFRFPPYASSMSIRRGIGVPRVLQACYEESGQVLHGPEAEQSSGLRRTFYADVDDDPCIQTNVITFLDPSLRAAEAEKITVTTSTSRITCNSSGIIINSQGLAKAPTQAR